ncbi:hypothetical protein V5799_031715 [Amblyomma americanum]|uniref:Secreted protein n=1 Tax=Amblyomma americanum TaxID=6943 RepID=A0AAQ4DT86_AMBAM
MRPAYCLLALFAALTCVFGTEKPPNCPRITITSFPRNMSALDLLCRAMDEENSKFTGSQWKLTVGNHTPHDVTAKRVKFERDDGDAAASDSINYWSTASRIH